MRRGSVANYIGDKQELAREIKAEEKGEEDTVRHMQNFLAAVKSRKHTDLLCDIEEGHRSAALAHLANASYCTGRKLVFRESTEQFTNDAAANALLRRDGRPPYLIPARV